MGNAIAFDTHAYVKKLREAGLDERQAEIQAEALVDLVEDRLATKKDVADLRRDLETIKADLQRDIEKIKADLQRDIKTLEQSNQKDIAVAISTAKVEIIRWVIAMSIISLGGMATINRMLPPVYVQAFPSQEMRYAVPVPPAPPSAPAPAMTIPPSTAPTSPVTTPVPPAPVDGDRKLPKYGG